MSSTIPNVLADRYASPAMRNIWSPSGRILLEREFWIAVLKSQSDLGLPVADGAIEAYEAAKTTINLAAIDERERITRHDVKARIEEFNELAGFEEIHKGMTSRDLTENVEQMQVYQSLQLIRDKSTDFSQQRACSCVSRQHIQSAFDPTHIKWSYGKRR